MSWSPQLWLGMGQAQLAACSTLWLFSSLDLDATNRIKVHRRAYFCAI